MILARSRKPSRTRMAKTCSHIPLRCFMPRHGGSPSSGASSGRTPSGDVGKAGCRDISGDAKGTEQALRHGPRPQYARESP